MANLRVISYDTGNLESQGHEYGDLSHNLTVLLQELDRVMNEEVFISVAGTANNQLRETYIKARETMENYPGKIQGVGEALIEAARTGKAIDNSLAGDVNINIA